MAGEDFGIGGEGGGGEPQAGGTGFGGLGRVLPQAFEGGDVAGVAGEFGEALDEQGGVIVAALADAAGVAGDRDE